MNPTPDTVKPSHHPAYDARSPLLVRLQLGIYLVAVTGLV
jgi:hypothetical protein